MLYLGPGLARQLLLGIGQMRERVGGNGQLPFRRVKISWTGPVDIRPEAHTPECNELVKALLQCYDENRWG